MRTITLLLLCMLLVLPLVAQRNVILIIADDLGTDYLGFYDEHVDTAAMPNVRKLLSQGVRFTNAWATPYCSSTRAGMLTGRYSFRTGVGAVVGGGSGTLNLNEITIPKLLETYKPGVYAKANIGKWHLHQPTPTSNLNNPNLMGYDHFQGPFIGALPDYYSWNKVTNGVSAPVNNYATAETANDAIRWIKTNSAKPFFLWLAFNAPHSPYHLPPAGLHSYTNLPGTQQHIMQNQKLYFKASLEALDHEIGRVLDSLKAYQKLANTDIIFIGDNGNAGPTNQAPVANHGKGTIYEYGVHVPFIIAGNSVIAPGRVSDALVSTTDLFATILELAGYQNWATQIPASKPVDSRSLVPILKNTETDVRLWNFAELFTSTPAPENGKTMRDKNYKLLRFDDGTEAFYNISADPFETQNLLTRSLTTVERLHYRYLCSEMTQLVGSGSFCTPTVGTETATVGGYHFRIAPNPSRGAFQIQLGDLTSAVQVSVINMLGQPVYTQEQRDAAPLEVSGLPPGVYWVQVSGKAGQTAQKVIIQ